MITKPLEKSGFFVSFTKNYDMKNLYIVFLFLISWCNAQVLNQYPKDQVFYKGGIEAFYKDVHAVFIDKKFNPCQNDNEIYFARILVTKENQVKFIKDNDSVAISKNKCAYDLTLNVLKELKGFNAPEVKGYKMAAVADFILFPKDLFERYQEGYNPYNYLVEPVYTKGKEKFKDDFHATFMSLFSNYHINGDVTLDFIIDEEGKIINPNVSPRLESQSFAKEFLRALSRIDKKWKPALYRGIPVKYLISMPMEFSINFYEK